MSDADDNDGFERRLAGQRTDPGVNTMELLASTDNPEHTDSSMIFGEMSIAVEREVPVVIRGADSGELLVGWLSEILYLFEVHGLAPADFMIDEITGDTLRGKIQGESFDPSRHPVEREVKAITYHQLNVAKDATGWRARLYVDL